MGVSCLLTPLSVPFGTKYYFLVLLVSLQSILGLGISLYSVQEKIGLIPAISRKKHLNLLEFSDTANRTGCPFTGGRPFPLPACRLIHTFSFIGIPYRKIIFLIRFGGLDEKIAAVFQKKSLFAGVSNRKNGENRKKILTNHLAFADKWYIIKYRIF